MNSNSLRNLKPFKPGVSGNPKGRPKGVSLTAEIRRVLEADDGELVRKLAEVVVERALAGEFQFIKLIFDRIDGPVTNRLHFGGVAMLDDPRAEFDRWMRVNDASSWPGGPILMVGPDAEPIPLWKGIDGPSAPEADAQSS